MKTLFVKSPPPGDFAYISSVSSGWQPQLHSLICNRRPVTYDHWPLRKFPQDVLEVVARQGYQHLILENDRWQHFFVPPETELNPGSEVQKPPPTP